MAISPTQLDAFSDLPATYAASLEDLTWNFIVELLSKYGSVKDPQDIDTNAWKQRMLTQAPQMRTFFQKQSAAGFKASRHAVRQSLAKAPLEDQQAANDWLGGLRQKKLLGTPKNLKQAHGVSKLIASAQNKTDEYLRMARRNMADNAYAGYRKIVTDAALYAKNGKEPRKALAMALEQSAKQGVPALIDRAGKNWQPDVYMRLVVNNQVQQLSNQVSVQRAKDYGTKVIISSHAGCRPTHQQYQGQIYSVDGDTSEYPDLYEATNYGSAGGLCGINCHHYPMPYVPGYGHPDFVELDPEENNRQYSLRQEQRRLERNVRAAKRKQVAAEKFDDPAGIAAARREVTAKQKAVREFVGKHPKELTRDYGRERVRIRSRRSNLGKSLSKDVSIPKKSESVVKKFLNDNLTDNLGKERSEEIAKRLDEAPENMQRMWAKYKDRLKFDKISDNAGSYFRPSTGLVTTEMADVDAVGESDYLGKYDVVYHEFGHAIDNFASSGSASRNISGDSKYGISFTMRDDLYDFATKMAKDNLDRVEQEKTTLFGEYWNNVPLKRKRNGELSGPTIRQVGLKMLSQELRDAKDWPRYGDVSDMIEAATGGKTRPGIGHGASYWKYAGMQETEAFAEMTSATINNPASLVEIKRIFPNGYKAYLQAVNDILEAKE